MCLRVRLTKILTLQLERRYKPRETMHRTSRIPEEKGLFYQGLLVDQEKAS